MSAAGQLIAVTSSQPATGKSVIAANLAFELARAGDKVILVDADHLPTQHQRFGIQSAPAATSAATRLIAQDRFTESEFSALCLQLAVPEAEINLLAGTSHKPSSDEQTTLAFQTLLEFLRLRFDFVVVDLANVENLNNAVTQIAQRVLLVELAEPIALARLIENQEQLSTQIDFEKAWLILNRVRESLLGPKPAWQLEQTLESRFALPIAGQIQDDQLGFDSAFKRNIPLKEAAKKSPALAGIAHLAKALHN